MAASLSSMSLDMQCHLPSQAGYHCSAGELYTSPCRHCQGLISSSGHLHTVTSLATALDVTVGRSTHWVVPGEAQLPRFSHH